MTTNEEPEQDRRGRDLPWLLFGCLALVLLLLADLGGWVATRDDNQPHANVTTGGRPLPPRSVTGAAGGAVVRTDITAAAPITVGRDLTVTARVLGKLAPGRVRPLVVSLHNTGTAALRVTGMQVSVGQPPDPGCKASWFAILGTAPAGTTVAARGSSDIGLHIVLRNEPVNQNACKALQVPFTISVDGARAGT